MSQPPVVIAGTGEYSTSYPPVAEINWKCFLDCHTLRRRLVEESLSIEHP